MLNLFANGLVLVGTGFLLGALIPIGQLIRQIPTGPVRRRWHVLALLVAIFVAGYLGYLLVFWDRHTELGTLIVPLVFFFGAIFVLLTARLALQTAIDIRRVVLLEQENITDPLIGIYNRRYLDRRLHEEFSRARRYNLPMAVLLLDIDLFKRVNDEHGHQVGDQVLSYLGRLVLDSIRESDIAARYGGEEILIIAPNTTATMALTLAERLRRHIETHELVLSSEPARRQAVRITISVGVASLSSDMTNSEQLVGRADEALYRAKQEGRNRVGVYDAVIPNAVTLAV